MKRIYLLLLAVLCVVLLADSADAAFRRNRNRGRMNRNRVNVQVFSNGNGHSFNSSSSFFGNGRSFRSFSSGHCNDTILQLNDGTLLRIR